ncbi:MAG: cupin domain-containing protein [Ignavibacteriae bacterium]|nr:cupin domain-containing protein [Ignavibacteriota bacterium]
MDILDFQPAIMTRAIVVKSAEDKQKDTVIMIAELGPYEAGPPLHYHPMQHETYEVLEGKAEFILGKQKMIVSKGEKIDIPPNTPHTFKNITNSWLRMQDVHSPALSFEEMMRELHDLVQSGKVKGFNNPRSLLYLSMLWVKHKEVQHSVTPPFFVMKVMATIGKLIGYKL